MVDVRFGTQKSNIYVGIAEKLISRTAFFEITIIQWKLWKINLINKLKSSDSCKLNKINKISYWYNCRCNFFSCLICLEVQWGEYQNKWNKIV